MTPTRALLNWIEVDEVALRHNLSVFRTLLPEPSRLLLVVKSNAYGHGAAAVVDVARRCGVDALGVHALDEAGTVRAAGWTGPLLVMGHVAHARHHEGLALDVEFTIFDLDTLRTLDRAARAAGRAARCHLKLETGTHRQGILEHDLPRFLDFFAGARDESPGSGGVRLHGLSMHFANIEDTTDHTYAREQLRRFEALCAQAAQTGFADVIRHCACSAAVLTMPETAFEMARIGIGAYGYWPSRETLVTHRAPGRAPLELRPVLTWKTRVTQVKAVPSGAFVGYGCTERVRRDTRMAVLPVGYADGYDRGMSRVGHVLVAGRRAPVLGRICMNVSMIDVTDIAEVTLEDEVTLIGRDGEEHIDAGELATWTQTIPYEIVARLSSEIPRFLRKPDGSLQHFDSRRSLPFSGAIAPRG